MAQVTLQGATITINVDDKGSLKQIETKSKKAGQGFNLLDKGVHSTDRAMKGLSQQSSNASKNFSKMSQGITGGLVPAYATLAAQLFAIDAVFRFLKSAADFRVLQEGQERFANVTGQAMKSLTRDLMAATDAQISYKDAAQASAIGLASGMSPDQLNQLGEAARKVSIALGRDTTDSFNRLVRGVTKAEPELLDELGIVLRLEEATTKYAAALGLNKNALTTYQKSQAIANDVLDQANEKFGLIEGNVSALNKLGIAFDELINSVRPFIATIAEFFGTVLADNIHAATGAMVAFVASIGKSLLPGIKQLDTGKLIGGMQQNVLASATGRGKAGQARLQRLQEGTYTKKDLIDFENSLKKKKGMLIKHNNWTKAQRQKMEMELKMLRKQREIDEATGLNRQRLKFQLHLQMMQAEYGKFVGTMKVIGQGMMMALSWVGYIGIAIVAIQAIVSIWKKFNPDPEWLIKYNKEAERLTGQIEGLQEEMTGIIETFKEGNLASRGLAAQMSQVGQAFQSADIPGKLRQLEKLELQRTINPKAYRESREAVIGLIDQMSEFNPELKVYAENLKNNKILTAEERAELVKIATTYVNGSMAVKAYNESKKNEIKLVNSLIQKLPKIPMQDLTKEYYNQKRALEDLIEASEDLFEVRKANLDLALLEQNLLISENINERRYQIQIAETSLEILQKSEQIGKGRMREAKQRLTYEKQLLKINKLQVDIAQAEYLLGQEIDSVTRRNEDRRLKNARLLISLEMVRLKEIEKQNDEMFQTVKALYEGLETELGTAFGKALRGEEDAFKDIGEKLTNILSNAMGKALSERMMQKMFGPMFADPADKMQKAMMEAGTAILSDEQDSVISRGFTAGSQMIEEAFRKGSYVASTNILRAMTGSNQATIDLLEEMNQVDTDQITVEKDRMQTRQKNLGIVEESEEYKRLKSKFSTTPISDDLTAQMMGADGEGFWERVAAGAVLSGGSRGAGPNFQMMEGLWADPEAMKADPEWGKWQELQSKYGGVSAGTGIWDTVAAARDEIQSGDDVWTDADLKAKERVVAERGLQIEDLTKTVKDQVSTLDTLISEQDGGTSAALNTAVGTDSNGNPALNVAPVKSIEEIEKEIAARQGAIKDGQGEDGKFGTGDDIMATGKSGDLTRAEKEGFEQFSGGVEKFEGGALKVLGGASMLFGAAGDSEKAAKLMEISAKLSMAAAIITKTTAALQAAQTGGIGGFFSSLFGFGRYGGVFSGPGAPSFSGGGVADGPNSGYGAVLHGTEAVVPLGNDRSIPVKMGKGTGDTNTTINVNMEGGSSVQSDGEDGKNLAVAINAAVQKELEVQRRPGGILEGGGG